jgi:uncharacterized membrane protein
MSDRNIFTSVTASVLSPFVEVIGAMRWFFLLAAILIAADLWFGIQAAKKRGERIKKSRALRRTFNKAIDYICWIFLAAVMGQAVGEPLEIPILPVLIMLIVIGTELESCVINYFEAHGKNVRVNVWRLFGKKVEESIDIRTVEKEEKETKQHNGTSGTDTTA